MEKLKRKTRRRKIRREEGDRSQIRLFLMNLAGFFSQLPGRILGQNPKSCPENKSCQSGVRNPGRKKFLPGCREK